MKSHILVRMSKNFVRFSWISKILWKSNIFCKIYAKIYDFHENLAFKSEHRTFWGKSNKISEIFTKICDFHKNLTFCKNLKLNSRFSWKSLSQEFQKIWEFHLNVRFSPKCEIFSKIWYFHQNLQFPKKFSFKRMRCSKAFSWGWGCVVTINSTRMSSLITF